MVRVTSCEICLQIVFSISFSGSSGYISSSKAFIYSLKDYDGYGYFKNDVTSSSYETYGYYNFVPTFGAGNDIHIKDNARWDYYSSSYCQCSSYRGRYCNIHIFTGSRDFRPSNVEVYYEAFST